MGNLITTSGFMVPTGYVKVAENASFPASNIGVYTKPYRPWKDSGTIATGSHWVGVDLGSAESPDAIVIDAINVNSVFIESSNASDFSVLTNSTPSGTARTVSKDPVDQRYKLYQELSAYVTLSRYWRVRANVASTTDGTNYMAVGSFVCVEAVTTWATNLAAEIGETYRKDVLAADRDPVEVGNPFAEIALSASVLPRSVRSTLFGLLGLGRAAPFVLYVNNSDTSQVYICRTAAEVTAFTRPGKMTVNSWLLREVV